MSQATVWVAALICLLFAASLRDTPGHDAWTPQTEAPRLPDDVGDRVSALSITVVLKNGAPAEGVLLRVFSIIGDEVYLAASRVTGPDGVMMLPDLPRGETWILAEKQGHARTSRRVVLEPGERKVELTLQDAETFEVVVVDPMQRPIRGVDVTLYGSDPLVHRTKTDDRGLARMTSLPAPPYAVEVVARGFDSKFIAKLGLEDSPFFVKLTRLGGLEIRVVDTVGNPVEAASVLVAGSSLWPARTAETNAAGRVTVSGLARGFYDMRAHKGNLISDTTSGVLLADGEIKEVELTIIAGTYVKVTVTDGEAEDAPPIEGANVALVEGGVSSFPNYGRTNAAGVVVLGPIAGVGAAVSARAEGYVARSAVSLEEAQTEVQISLLRGGRVIGDVVDEDGFPVDGARLEVVGVDVDGMPILESSDTAGFREDHFDFALPGAIPLVPAGELGVMPIVPDIPFAMRGGLVVARSRRTGRPWVSSRDGSFELHPVTPGRIRVVARHPSFIEGVSGAVELQPGGAKTEVHIVMRRGGVLEGRVLEQDRTPVAGARVEVVAVVGTVERITITADDGSFAFAALPQEVVISVARPEAPEHVVERLTVAIPPDERREIDILLPVPRDPVLVRVSDDRGYPIERVEIHVSSVEPQVPLIRTLFSSDDGEAEILDARGLPLRFVISRRGHAPAVYEVDPASAIVDLTMIPGLAATGRIESKWGNIADAQLTLLTPTAAVGARSDEEGVFRFRDLAPGPARLLVVAAGFVPLEIDVEIAGDAYRDVDLGDFELVQAGTVKGVVVDENGDPVAGARVASGRVPTFLPMGELPIGVVAANRRGEFVLAGLTEGEHFVEAYRVGYGRSAARVEVRANDTASGIEIELIEDPDVDVTRVKARASLAVTLSESSESGELVILFEHVPLRGEAQRAGILAGDQFLSHNGYPVRSLEEARQRLNGPISEDFVIELGRPPNLRWRVRVRRESLRR